MPQPYVQPSIESIIGEWPDASREAAERLMGQYGAPDEVTPHALLWYDNGPWKRTMVLRESVEHDWPMGHQDVVEQVIDYRVPVERIGDLVRFDGSLVVDRTRGELTAHCADESSNLLALNLAHDILNEGKSIEKARQEYEEHMRAKQRGEATPYMERLQFSPSSEGAADRDEETIGVGEALREKARGLFG